MKRLLFPLTAALLASAASVWAQTPAVPASNSGLPAGLIRQGNVIMMAPVSSSDSGPYINGEHHESSIRYLSAADHDIYERAFDAASSGDWTGAKGIADQGHDATARRLIQWRYLLDKNSGASFSEIDQFLRNNPSWPARDTLFARAENALDPQMDPHAVVAWFGTRAPVTGIGKVRLGEALIATGAQARGRDLIRDAWINNSFDSDKEYSVAQNHGDILTPDVDAQRMNALLWRGDTSGARREMSRVSGSAAQIAQARISLQSQSVNGASGLSADLQSNSGVLFDRARALRRAGQNDAAESTLRQVAAGEAARANEDAWFAEVNLDTRQALKDHNYQVAYGIAADNGMSSGSNYADSEFLAGWIALRFLHQPRTALGHFQKLTNAVSRPISLARGHYWQGRAYEDLGELSSAYREYRLAAQHPETFYGQLALAKTDATPTLHIPDNAVDTATAKAAFDSDDLVPAIKVLGDLGEVSLLRTFALHDIENFPGPGHVRLLCQMLTGMGFPDIALRVAKTAAYTGTFQVAYTHPVVTVPAYVGTGTPPDPAFVLGIIRQETEFDQYAVSGAGAVGIMQLLPGTAHSAANSAGVEYDASRLISDQSYNMQLGMLELNNGYSDFGGSYILAAARYNAGPGNVNKWLAAYGDPRGGTDPIDWIESIPFNETRNYVMRSIENMQVYRNRLAGRDLPLRITSDLSKTPVASLKPLTYAPKAADNAADTLAGETPVPVPRPADAAPANADPSR
ncbi:MAG TPA: lytic transglycosylase domain-containing protein [Rhizomicrobium sp.]|jgi:soluble lytic murein transglycosylase|nr:lytic transglycosylase domain-containing protein [Rhizomicrobium sp.]